MLKAFGILSVRMFIKNRKRQKACCDCSSMATDVAIFWLKYSMVTARHKPRFVLSSCWYPRLIFGDLIWFSILAEARQNRQISCGKELHFCVFCWSSWASRCIVLFWYFNNQQKGHRYVKPAKRLYFISAYTKKIPTKKKDATWKLFRTADTQPIQKSSIQASICLRRQPKYNYNTHSKTHKSISYYPGFLNHHWCLGRLKRNVGIWRKKLPKKNTSTRTLKMRYPHNFSLGTMSPRPLFFQHQLN